MLQYLYTDCNIRRHCAIEFQNEVIITGGQDDPRGVSVYNIDGFKENLPNLVNGRYLHGCSYFTNNNNDIVSLNLHLSLSSSQTIPTAQFVGFDCGRGRHKFNISTSKLA